MNFLYFFGGLSVGMVLVLYSKWITDNTNRMDFAEKYLGPTGTYTFWKLMGVLLMGFGFWALFNL